MKNDSEPFLSRDIITSFRICQRELSPYRAWRQRFDLLKFVRYADFCATVNFSNTTVAKDLSLDPAVSQKRTVNFSIYFSYQ
jgi:hypothetical protein